MATTYPPAARQSSSAHAYRHHPYAAPPAQSGSRPKWAAEKEKLLRKKLEAINSVLHECITELTQRTIMMEAENLSIDDLSEEQKSRSAALRLETLKKFTAPRPMLPRDEVFPHGMERPT